MASNKHALIRYRSLDKCFSNYKVRYTFQDLHEAVNKTLENYDQNTNGVGRAQLYADIAFMESSDGWNVDIDKFKDGGREVYYRYKEQGFSINNMPLNEVETNSLRDAMELLGHFKGMPQFEWVNEIIPKLQQGIKPDKVKPVISFDANQYLKGIEWLGELFNAITYKRVMNVTYQDFKASEPYVVEFHPYYLKQYNNRWYAIGYNPFTDRSNWTLALDRIMDVKESKAKYKTNKEIDWDDYFEDIVGVTIPENGKTEKIELFFAPQAAQYVVTKPLHGSQKKIQLDEKGLLVSIEVMINQELESLILSFGDRVRVLKPTELKKKIRETLKNALECY